MDMSWHSISLYYRATVGVTQSFLCAPHQPPTLGVLSLHDFFMSITTLWPQGHHHSATDTSTRLSKNDRACLKARVCQPSATSL